MLLCCSLLSLHAVLSLRHHRAQQLCSSLATIVSDSQPPLKPVHFRSVSCITSTSLQAARTVPETLFLCFLLLVSSSTTLSAFLLIFVRKANKGSCDVCRTIFYPGTELTHCRPSGRTSHVSSTEVQVENVSTYMRMLEDSDDYVMAFPLPIKIV